MLRAIEEQHRAGVPYIDTGFIWDSDSELGTLKKAVDSIEFREVTRDLPPRPWQQDTSTKDEIVEESGTEAVQNLLDDILELNSEME